MPISDTAAHLAGAGAVAELERKLSELYGMRYALCVSNATTGLLATALALGLRNREFVTTPYTYGASLSGWLLLGNRPVFADIDPETLTIDSDSAGRCFTQRVKAILASDIFGVPCDSIALRKLADRQGCWYIADAAQSFGARRDGFPASSLADALVLSFTAGKILDVGEGGAVLTNHSSLYEKLVWWTQHPYRQHRDLGLNLENEFGLNGRIHPFAAVKANAAFVDSLHNMKVRQRQCLRMLDTMNGTGLVEPVDLTRRNIESSFFRLTAAWNGVPRSGDLRDQLRSHGIEAETLSAPVRLIYKQPAFLAQYGERMRHAPCCPVAEDQAARRFAIVRSVRSGKSVQARFRACDSTSDNRTISAVHGC
ncbi:MAG: DegT/DnrJ/EryC1/StrS family aminotransferase [Candidatus Acidiferrales bacterium]